MLALQDKVILLTGGSRGIGAAIVHQLGALGATVVYVNRTELGRVGGYQIRADVSDPAAMHSVADRVESEYGPVFGVVANAGITHDALFTKMTQEALGGGY